VTIRTAEVLPVEVPIDQPYGQVRSVYVAVARLRTDGGLEGLGHALPLYPRHFRSLVVAMEEMAEMLVGEDPRQPERLWRKLNPGVMAGILNMAMSALDVAIWDLTAKASGLPLYRLLGGSRNRVPVYASLRLGREHKPDRLQETAASLVRDGFRAMKMNLGANERVEDEIARVKAVREVIGYDVDLLVDVNSLWTPARAIRVGHAIEEFRLFWLEDPVALTNIPGLAEVRRELETPIATGETLFGHAAFEPLFEARAVDFPMPDLMRVGGITPFMKIAHMAECFGLPICNHLMPEISAQLVAAAANGRIVEFVPFAWKLFRGCPELRDGELVLSERPGHGLELDEEFAKAHRVPA
jgi:L-alanine-DL-glutamate epimerase-like enolase superfamily enzyme